MLVSLHCAGAHFEFGEFPSGSRRIRAGKRITTPATAGRLIQLFGLTCAKLLAFGARFHNGAALFEAALRRSRRIKT
jgi:hypothetical protein